MRPVDGKLGGAYSLHGKEDEHAYGRSQEQEPSAQAIAQSSSKERPTQVPNLKDSIDEELNGGYEIDESAR